MPRKKNAITKTDGYSMGKSTSQEQSVLKHLISLVHTQTKAYYILWKYAPELLPAKFKTFDDLKNNYKVFTAGVTEKTAENWLMEENVQTAVKWLLKREHQKKLIELYNIYYDRAKEDTNAFKAFIDFSNQFFNDDKKSDVLDIIQNIPDSELEDKK
jgi:acyl-CoA-binding protein